MNGIGQLFERQLLQSEWAERIGWALFHSLWQMALVAAVYALLAYVLRNGAANVRYILGCATLLAMVVLPMATVALVTPSAAEDRTMAEAAIPQVGKFPNPEPIVLEAAVLAPSPVADDPVPVAMLPASQPRESVNLSLMARGESRWLAAIRPWLPWATALWLLGVLILSLRPLRGWLHVRRLQRYGLSPFPSELEKVAARLVRTLRMNSAVAFAMSALVEVPTVVGYMKPIVLLPTSAVTGLTAAEIEMILAHELAHVRRHDYLVNLLQTVIESLLFYHPAMWWVSSQIRHERENCCDDIAVATNSRIDYARALMRLEEQRSTVRLPALAATGGSLLRRVRRLLGQPTTEFGYRNATAWLTGLATVSVVAVALAMGGDESDEVTPPLETVGPSNSESAWGQPMNGLQCRLVAVPPETNDESPELTKTAEAFSAGDNLTFTVELKNVSDEPITVIGTRYGDSYGTSAGKLNTRFLGPHMFAFEFTDAEGKPIPRAERSFDDKSEVIVLSSASSHELAPGESHMVLLRPAQFLAPMDFHLPSGEYLGKVHYLGPSKSALARFSEFWPDRAQAKAWSGKVTSNSVDFTIANVPNAADPPQLIWGPENNGLQAAIEFVIPKETAGDPSQPPGIPVGSELKIVFHVKNVSDRVITFVSETARQGDAVKMTDADGNDIEVKGVWYSGAPIDVRWNLKPGEEATLNLLTPKVPTDLTPGKYDVQCTIRFNSRRSTDGDGNITFPLPGDWQDELVTGTALLFLRADTVEGDSSAKPPVGNSGENTSTPKRQEAKGLANSVVVELRDQEGEPITGAMVLVYDGNNFWAGQPVDFEQESGTTNSQGLVEFSGILDRIPADSSYRVQVQPLAGADWRARQVYVHDGKQLGDDPLIDVEQQKHANVGVRFTLREACPLEFEVVDAKTGKPIHAQVLFQDDRVRKWTQLARLDDGGQHDFTTVVTEMSDARFLATREGYYPQEFKLNEQLAPDKTVKKIIELEPAPLIELTVLDTEAAPAVGATLEYLGPEPRSAWRPFTPSAGDGRISLKYPEFGEHARYRVSHDRGTAEFTAKGLPEPVWQASETPDTATLTIDQGWALIRTQVVLDQRDEEDNQDVSDALPENAGDDQATDEIPSSPALTDAASPAGDVLRLEGDAITEEAIAQLAGRKWERVALIGGRIDARIVENLRHATSIHALELSGERLSGSIPRLEHVHGLVELKLGTSLVGQDLEAIGRLVQLEVLQLPQHLTINASGAREIAQLTNLKSLNLYNVNIDDSGIAELSMLKQLEQLDLTHTRVTDEGLKVLAHMPRLKTLELYRHPSWHIKQQISDQCLAVIVQLTDLERLSLSGKITNEGLLQIARLPRLKHLSILGTEVTSAGLGALEGSGIESFMLSADQLGRSTDVASWKKLKALKYVWVVGKISQESIEEIEEWRKVLPNLSWGGHG